MILVNHLSFLFKDLKDLNPYDFEGHDILVHMAAHTPNWPYDSLNNCIYHNLIVPLDMLKSAKLAGISKFVIIGSCFEYGLSANNYEFIPPNAPLLPTLSYPCSKALASTAFTQWSLEQNVSIKILRLFQIYGPGELSSRLWPSLVNAARANKDLKLTKGEQVRDFIHVEDIVDGLVRCSL